MTMSTRPTARVRPRLLRTLTALAVGALLATGVALASGAGAATNPHERGPDPTVALLRAAAGPFATTQTTVGKTNGFGGASIYYPTEAGTFGAVAIAPGFLAPRSTLSWLAARIASHGFVVINIDTLTRQDSPESRGDQLLAALDHLTRSSPVRHRVDARRLGVLGHSMGGGGTLEAAARERSDLRAAVPLTPWHATKSWPKVTVPTMIIGAELDDRARVDEHAEPFYESLSAAPEKAYLELRGAEHRIPISPEPTIGMFTVAWLKRFIDDDQRYEQFLCPPPSVDAAVSEYRHTCDPTATPVGR